VKSFATTAILRRPLGPVWTAMRDRLDEIVPSVADIRSFSNASRETIGDVVRLVNVWEAAPQLPATIVSLVPESLLRWKDYAVWVESTRECRWRIETAFASDRIHCTGTTIYEEAIGGRGTRITFRGQLDIRAGGVISGALAPIAESVVTSIIPRNFTNLANAVGSYLDRHS
jgi:hypothetical protein